MERYPDNADAVIPAIYMPGDANSPPATSASEKIFAPSTAGIDIINENFTAYSLLNPDNRPPVIVAPLLDMPGRVPKS
jgi:hypothetical protein